MNWGLIGAVATGGAIGSVFRYIVSVKISQIVVSGFPWGTFAVNVIGAFFMGVVVGLVSEKIQISQELRVLITAGVLGSFTTFSTFSLELVNLMENKLFGISALYLLSSVIVGILCLMAGLYLVRGLA